MTKRQATNKVFDIVEFHCRRKRAEVQDMLVPEIPDALTAAELAAWVAERLRVLPPEQRTVLRIKTVLAIADLQDVLDTLSRHRDAVRSRLRALDE
jgi:hypothetical protein